MKEGTTAANGHENDEAAEDFLANRLRSLHRGERNGMPNGVDDEEEDDHGLHGNVAEPDAVQVPMDTTEEQGVTKQGHVVHSGDLHNGTEKAPDDGGRQGKGKGPPKPGKGQGKGKGPIKPGKIPPNTTKPADGAPQDNEEQFLRPVFTDRAGAISNSVETHKPVTPSTVRDEVTGAAKEVVAKKDVMFKSTSGTGQFPSISGAGNTGQLPSTSGAENAGQLPSTSGAGNAGQFPSTAGKRSDGGFPCSVDSQRPYFARASLTHRSPRVVRPYYELHREVNAIAGAYGGREPMQPTVHSNRFLAFCTCVAAFVAGLSVAAMLVYLGYTFNFLSMLPP